MIEILTVVFRNYELLAQQVAHWERLGGEHRFLVCDNTPVAERRPISRAIRRRAKIFRLDVTGIDGETHGAGLDLLAREATSDIVCIQDTDFFWLQPGILDAVKESFGAGYRALGAAGFYPDWQAALDPRWPGRAGHLAPVCYGMFVERSLALEDTFVVTAAEAAQVMETGWRLRRRLIEQRIKTHVFPGFTYPDQADPQISWFGNSPDRPIGVHLLKGSSSRVPEPADVEALLQRGMRHWIAG